MKQLTFLCFILLARYGAAQVFDVDTLVFSGPIDNRINLVILGDGYQASELPLFVSDASSFTNALFAETPYDRYRNFFNVFIIKVPSNQSGASHPGTATDTYEPEHPILYVDNYFGSTFDFAMIHRLLFATKTSTITNVLANNFPLYDQVVILVNSPYYGGSGGLYATASANIFSAEIAIHELGHSFVKLADEYYAGDIYANERINMTQESNPNNVKWKNWLNSNNVGIYHHCCGGNSLNWYRPHNDCKMRVWGGDFCPVCSEGTIEKIHDLTNLIDSYTPSNTHTIDAGVPVSFSVDLITPIPNSLQIEWALNGTAIPAAANSSSVFISPNDLAAGNNIVSVMAEDTTALLRIDNHNSIHFSAVSWNINSLNTRVSEISSAVFNIRVFPNPAQDILFFSITSDAMDEYTVTISDLAGRQMSAVHVKPTDKDSQIQLGNLPAGIYLVEFRFGNGAVVSKKIRIEG